LAAKIQKKPQITQIITDNFVLLHQKLKTKFINNDEESNDSRNAFGCVDVDAGRAGDCPNEKCHNGT
jgi:hypothetical protein